VRDRSQRRVASLFNQRHHTPTPTPIAPDPVQAATLSGESHRMTLSSTFYKAFYLSIPLSSSLIRGCRRYRSGSGLGRVFGKGWVCDSVAGGGGPTGLLGLGYVVSDCSARQPLATP